jgi:hypothetical protein
MRTCAAALDRLCATKSVFSASARPFSFDATAVEAARLLLPLAFIALRQGHTESTIMHSTRIFHATLAFATAISLAACSAGESDSGDGDTNNADATLRIDLAQYCVVSTAVVTGDKANALRTTLRDRGARTLNRDRLTFAGLTEAELDGRSFDPDTRPESAFGLLCDETESPTCATTAVTRTADVVTTVQSGVPLVTRFKIHGKLAGAVASALPPTGPARVGANTVGHAPSGVECVSTSGRDANGKIVTCTIPGNGFGVMTTMKALVDDGTLTKRQAETMVRRFFPKG